MDYFYMTAALGRYQAYVDQVDAYNESFKAANLRFTEGVGSVVEYVIAKNNLDRASQLREQIPDQAGMLIHRQSLDLHD